MLTVGKLTLGAEDYYLMSVAQGAEEYYTGSGEAPGEWIGRGTAALGLAGTVDPADLHTVLSGASPLDGTPIRSAAAIRATVAGFDLTFSSPKSVSLLYGLTTEEIADSVRLAHDRAVAAGIDYIEAHAVRARRGHNGEVPIETEGVIATAFRHRTSRAGDPQLHTHVLIANAVQGLDGAWSAPDGRLFYMHARAAGYLYQAVLRHELAAALGVSFTDVVKGSAEVEGVDPALMNAFSTRRNEIEARLASLGLEGGRASHLVALETRRSKTPLPQATGVDAPGSLRDIWMQKAQSLSLDTGHLTYLVGPPRYLDLSGGLCFDIADELTGPEGMTAELSTFTRRDVVREVAARLPDGADAHVVDHVANMVLASPATVALGITGPGGEERLTSTELLCVEASLVEFAQEAKSAGRAVANPETLRGVLRGNPSASGEQMAMVARITTSGAGVDAVVGAAGTGKTFALSMAREIWEKDNMRVTGAALAARAARGLEGSTGIASTTLAALDAKLSTSHDAFSHDTVLVIDEAAMVGTRMLSRIVTNAVSLGGKVVLIGDHRQLPEIESGGAFAAIAREVDAVHLSANRRQVNAWERSALASLRDDDVSVALGAYQTRGRIREADTFAGARHRLVADWFEERHAYPYKDVRMFALRRGDVEDLNTEARTLLRRKGLLGPAVYRTSNGADFAHNEEVVCLRNDKRLGVFNGTRAKVVGVAPGGLRVSADSNELRLPHSYMESGHLSYGYASTIHKAQGATVDTAFVLGSGSLYREAAYVAMSRAREASYLYVAPDTLGLSTQNTNSPASESAHTPSARTPNLTLLQAVSRSNAKTLATEELAASRRRPKNGDAGDGADSFADVGLISFREATSTRLRYRAGPEPGDFSPKAERAGEAGSSGSAANVARPSLFDPAKSVPRYLKDTLGRRPTRGLPMAKWDYAAQAIKHYRAISGWSGRSALGPPPPDRVARMQHVSALDAILDYEREMERARTRERSRQHSNDVGLSR